jgi:hypothetical protein
MMRTSHAGVPASPMRLLEMLTDRFGVFEALAHSTIKLNRCTSADEDAMDPLAAEAVLEFADALRIAPAASAPGPRATQPRASNGSRLPCFHTRACPVPSIATTARGGAPASRNVAAG